jgi:spore coat protein A, manganese oxidase
MEINRRNALKFGGVTIIGGVALAVPLGQGAQTKGTPSGLSPANFPKPYTNVITKAPAATPRMINGVAYYDFAMKRNPGAQILSGQLKTPVFGYNGTFPGPRIELNRGTPAVVRMRNHLPAVGPFGSPAQTSVHLHGSASLPEYDGYANDITKVGEYKDYRYPNFQPARTLWYHDHGVHWTAQQAYGGLAAMYVIHDKDEQTLLPAGQFDVPLVVNDAMFAADGSLAFNDNGHSGLWGDVILVNGRPWPVMKVQRRTYRFRVLNCSISRSYNWRLSNGMPLQVVATDGGLMPKGVAVSSMRHAGAERYEIVIDFSKVPASTRRIELLNGSNENNIDFASTARVMAFDLLDVPVTKTRAKYGSPGVQEDDPTWNRNYDKFPLVDSEIMSLPTDGNYKRRQFRVERKNGEWKFAGTSWHEVVNSDFSQVIANPEIGDVEIWEITNKSGGWFHPVHIHLIDFRIIKRTGGVGRVLPHEEGPKDVVYVGESETVHVLIKFTKAGANTVPSALDPGFKGGRYMVHCHNLPHEDHDMMAQFSVGKVDLKGVDPHHPIKAAQPRPDPSYRG